MALTTNFVSPSGPRDAKIVFLGQAPGADEDRLLEGFTGSAGQFVFNPSLKAAGLFRSECLIWNLFHRRPPSNDVGYFYQDKKCTKLTWEGQEHVDETRVWLESLLRQRDTTGSGPNILVALGREAMLALTGRDQISKWRGSVLPCTLVPGFKVYPAFHPAYILRLMNEPEEKLQGQRKQQKLNALPLFLRDLQRIKIQAE
jgi:DNA polymerase